MARHRTKRPEAGVLLGRDAERHGARSVEATSEQQSATRALVFRVQRRIELDGDHFAVRIQFDGCVRVHACRFGFLVAPNACRHDRRSLSG